MTQPPNPGQWNETRPLNWSPNGLYSTFYGILKLIYMKLHSSMNIYNLLSAYRIFVYVHMDHVELYELV